MPRFDLQELCRLPVSASLDWYQLTQLQALRHQLDHRGGITLEMRYAVRTKGANTARLAHALSEVLEAYEDRHVLLPGEIEHLRGVRYMSPGFLEEMRDLRLHPKDAVTVGERGGELDITIRGPVSVILYEQVILALVSELWSQLTFPDSLERDNASRAGVEMLRKELEGVAQEVARDRRQLRLTEGGTRRRFSYAHHRRVLELLRATIPDSLFGTSNVWLARELGLRLVGTQAHLFGMLFQQHGGTLATFPTRAMQAWVNEYRGDLGYMLPDVLTTEAWLKHVDLYFGKLFDGYRHDSGDPHVWTRRVIEHLRSLGIDPATKFAVYSDKLNLRRMLELWSRYEEAPWRTSYIIGTYLTNNVPGHRALDQVIKLSTVNGQPVAKVSDEPHKGICQDPNFLALVKSTFNIA